MSATRQLELSSTNADILAVELFEVEMSSQRSEAGCSSCDDVRERFAQAVMLAKPILATVGIVPTIVTRHVTTEKEARVSRVAASPTIRVGGKEVRPAHRDHTENGRVWSWQGEDYAQPPLGMLVDLLLRGYAAQRPPQSLAATDIAPYVTQFFTRDESQKPSRGESTCGCL